MHFVPDFLVAHRGDFHGAGGVGDEVAVGWVREVFAHYVDWLTRLMDVYDPAACPVGFAEVEGVGAACVPCAGAFDMLGLVDVPEGDVFGLERFQVVFRKVKAVAGSEHPAVAGRGAFHLAMGKDERRQVGVAFAHAACGHAEHAECFVCGKVGISGAGLGGSADNPAL